MPLLIWPVGLALSAGAGYFAGSWFSDGWLKWLIILILVIFVFTQAKKMGFIK